MKGHREDADASTFLLAVVALGICALISLMTTGCVTAEKGPTKARYAELLHQARSHNRECGRILKEYRNYALMHPEQGFDALEFDLAGH